MKEKQKRRDQSSDPLHDRLWFVAAANTFVTLTTKLQSVINLIGCVDVPQLAHCSDTEH